jgi:alpha-tubulin suppressor-like RCC1 family protein
VHGLRNIKIIKIEAGRHSAALSDCNQLFLWGPARESEKPFLEPYEVKSEKHIMEVSVGETVTAILDSAGRVFTWGTCNTTG